MKQLPDGYSSILSLRQTETAIKLIKTTFERNLSSELRLFRVTSPLFVPAGSGINDDLSGTERPIQFKAPNLGNVTLEVIQSLAKWKRMALADYQYGPGTGIYTDMNAIRPDDVVDEIHSIYVDQWDWELIMDTRHKRMEFLHGIVERLYEAIRRTEFAVHEHYPSIELTLPPTITFVPSTDAYLRYPKLSPRERENELAREYGAVCITGIGWPLPDGKPHGLRAPDYDDWNLNADIIVWDGVRKDSLELSSMGIRVDRDTLMAQLKAAKVEGRAELYWHKRLLAGDFPQTIGGGIGQSRLCMFLLKKAHIGEVQASVWDHDSSTQCCDKGVSLMQGGNLGQHLPKLNVSYDAFTKAVHSGDIQAIIQAVGGGADPNRDIQYGRRALHFAVSRGEFSLVKYLLGAGANPNVQDEHGDTPLMIAAQTNNAELIELFIRVGADLNIRNERGLSAATWAESEGFTEASIRLQESGAEEPYNRSPLQVMIVQGALDNIPEDSVHATIVQSLGAGFGINHQDIFGATSLMTAVGRGKASLAKILIELGADLLIRDADGHTALDWAKDGNHKDCVKILERAGAGAS